MRRTVIHTLALTALAAAAWMALPPPASASTRYDPRLRFRTISTTRFDIYFHQAEEGQAKRLAVIAEQVAREMDATLGPPSGRVHVILVDQTDTSNGWATPVPYNLIEITAAPPDVASNIGNTDDWLRLAFTHEYTHVVHLGRSRGWIGGLRYLFGRLPVLYPNLFLPQFQIEGIATYEETAVTGQGRVPAGDFRMIVDRAASARRFEPLDRTSGGLVDWPGGTAAYVYGAYFHQFLADRYGAAALRRLADETAGRLPYLGAPAFRKIFGKSLGALWSEFAATRGESSARRSSSVTRLTHHGFRTGAPRYDAEGRLYYLTITPNDFPALMVIERAGAAPRRIALRYLGGQTAIAGNTLVFDAQEVVANVALKSDLYAVPTGGGHRQRLTSGARAADPDLSPDGRTIVCTVQRADRRELATLPMDATRIAEPSPLVSEADVDFGSPRWSPDGRTIVAERRVRGRGQDLVLIDPSARRIVGVVPGSAGRSATPVWSLDGRRIVFAADLNGRGFEIVASEPSTGQLWRLDGTGDGAESPTFAPDGSAVAFVGYAPDGYDLYSLPLTPAAWVPIERQPETAAAAPSALREDPSTDGWPVSKYTPWRTLRPTFWTPTVESDADEIVVGAAAGSGDALGRHYWIAEGGWSTARARPDWSVSYVYDRWWPTIFASVSDDTDPWLEGTLRTIEFNVGTLLPVRRVRWTQTVLAALHSSNDAFECFTCAPAVDTDRRRTALRAGWLADASRSYGYSIGPQDGWSLGAATEVTREALGADGDGVSATLDLRVYLPVRPRHAVLAARAAAAGSWGDREVRRLFSAAGNGPQPGGFEFGSDAIGLLRGFAESDVAGFRAATINVDYRVPLFRPERGAGTLPVFVRTIHGALFVDAGNAWRDRFRSADVRVAIGGELSVDTVLGHALPLTITGGAAWRRDGDRGSDAAAFARIGRAF